jgi:hypothetical protein
MKMCLTRTAKKEREKEFDLFDLIISEDHMHVTTGVK